MEHYFTENPQSEIRESHFSYEINGNELRFVSVSGVFAFGQRVDKASELLIESFRPSGASAFILDVGCGFGPISLFIKKRYPHLQVTGLDINERAVAYAQKNRELNHLDVEIIKSNLYDKVRDRCFGDIVSNPPIAAGKAMNTRLIFEAKELLENKGALWLVAYHNKGGETLKKIMKECFGNVEDREKSGGVRVYRSVNNGEN